MATRFTMPIEQAIKDDASGSGSGYKLNFYETGTVVRKDSFSDNALTSANANPVVADSAGRFGDIFLESGTYKVVLTDENDVEIWTADPVQGSTGTSGVVDEKTTAYTVTVDDGTKVLAVDATAGAVTITLLAAATAGDGFELTIKKTDSSANAVTIDGNGAETIDGAATLVLPAQNDSVTIRSDGSNWLVVSDQIPIITTRGDVIRGSSTGAAERLAVGTAGQIVGTDATDVAYVDIRPTLAKTAAYTIVATDNRKVVLADATAGAFTVTLPAAPATDMVLTVKKSDSGTNAVTVDGNGKTIEGSATLPLVSQYDFLTIIYNGTSWFILHKRISFTSTEQTVTADTVLDVAHPFGVMPDRAEVLLRNKTTELGYAVGDEIILPPGRPGGLTDSGVTYNKDATNVTIVQGVQITVHSQSTLNGAAVTVGNWKWVVRAWL